MNNKDILLIAHFSDDFNGKGNSRFNYLADFLSQRNFDVELVTSSFSHKRKKEKLLTKNRCSYKITIVSEPGYYNNVSLKRLYSHYMMAKNLKKYLKSRKKPDFIYCSVPALDVAKIAVDYAKKNDIKLILDIQDLWPEAFKMVFNLPIISDILFHPMKKQADYIYEAADEIISVSQTYLDRALKVNKRCKEGYIIFLGTELEYFDRLAANNQYFGKYNDEIWLAYIGTLGHSYDITTVIDALDIMKGKGIKNIRFVVMGDGPLKSKFENYAKEKGVFAEFKGRLDYGKMVGVLKNCDLAVNPIISGSAGSVINKVGDYAAAGLPVLNMQESMEYRELIENYQAGINCITENPNDLADKIHQLIKNPQLRENMGENNRKLAVEKFDRKKTYQKIVELLV